MEKNQIEVLENRLGRKYLKVPIELVGESEHEHLDLPNAPESEDLPTWMIIDAATISAYRPAKFTKMQELIYTGIHFNDDYIVAKVDPEQFSKLFLSL